MVSENSVATTSGIAGAADAVSVTYSGTTMTKKQLMLYLNSIIQIKRQIDECSDRMNMLRSKNAALSNETKRRCPPDEPFMHKPSGLAALSKKKKKEYEDWLAKEDERKQTRLQWNLNENQRMQMVREEIERNDDEIFSKLNSMREQIEKYKELMQMHIIAPEYREENIVEKLLSYLMCSRAQTLTEALNVYHEEAYRDNMLNLQKEKNRLEEKTRLEMSYQIQNMMRQQAELQREYMQAHAEQMRELTEEAKRTRRAAEMVEFLELVDHIN